MKTINFILGIVIPLKQEKMKIKTFKSYMIAAVPSASGSVAANGPLSYLIGGIVALLILGYLVYTLLRPDKF